MLKDNLFKIINLKHGENTIHASLELNKDNEILKGHFPGQPVLPGACMVQILKEVLEEAIESDIRLKKADNIKFLNLIVPDDNNVLQLDLSYSFTGDKVIYVMASLTANAYICFKFKGAFTV